MSATISSSHSSKTGRDGIALIIVLGLLAVLVIFGVSFSISMRTERMATRSYVDVVKARHLTHTALYRVLGEHLAEVTALNTAVYPPWDAYTKHIRNVSEIKLTGSRDSTSGAVFVPASLRTDVFAVDDTVEWLPLEDATTDINGNRKFYGEYAFLVVNNSGLLDANQIGGRESELYPRLTGTNVAEIRFHDSILPEVNPGAHTNFKAYRNEFRKYESVSEVYYLNSSSEFEKDLGARPLKQNNGYSSGSWADNLHVFSRAPVGYADNALRANVDVGYIGGPATNWNITEIKTALASLKNPNIIPDIDAFVGVMYDYADESMILYGADDDQKFNRISSKPVPMINEVAVSNRLALVKLDDDTYELTHTVYLTVETWYPFTKSQGESFFVQYGNGSDIPGITLTPGAMNGPYTPLTSSKGAPFTPDATSFHTDTFAFRQIKVFPAFPEGSEVTFEFHLKLDKELVVKYAGDNTPTVDRVLPTWKQDLIVTESVTLDSGSSELLGETSVSANDPRINWDPSASTAFGSQWEYATVTLGNRNDLIIKGNYPDEYDFIYARRGPITSVGELGYLLYDATKPWQTVRLIGEKPAVGALAIDRLIVEPKTSYPKKGLVNINTRQRDALAATIWTMPIEKYPEMSSTRLNDVAQTRNLADYIINQIKARGAVTNMSQLAERLDSAQVDMQLGITNDKFTRESLVRNSFGLWTTRHQLFTIFLAARTFSDTYNPGVDFAKRSNFVTAEQRAVAVVWRDPFEITDEAGNKTHQTYVQFFHWFSGAFGD